jgi:hypothetical protein
MMKLSHKFVTSVPRILEDGVIYISVEYATAIHKCCCGCGNEVVTPFSPADWKLIFDGETISLYPSIGNWNLKCQSHYWITESKVVWATKWNKKRIAAVRKKDVMDTERKFKEKGQGSFWERVFKRK